MREVEAHPERMMLFQDSDQLLGNALWQNHRDLGPDPDEFDVLDRAQATEQPVKFVVTQCQGVAARHQDVTDLRVVLEISQSLFPLADRELVLPSGIADDTGARAV